MKRLQPTVALRFSYFPFYIWYFGFLFLPFSYHVMGKVFFFVSGAKLIYFKKLAFLTTTKKGFQKLLFIHFVVLFSVDVLSSYKSLEYLVITLVNCLKLVNWFHIFLQIKSFSLNLLNYFSRNKWHYELIKRTFRLFNFHEKHSFT